MAQVPFLNLKAAYEELKPALDQALLRTAASGWYLLGEELKAFEAAYARHTQTAHCVGVANGLDALHLGLAALGVGPGDEVIVPSNTYIATWLAVSAVGAVPVPVEPDEATFNLDPARIRAALTSKTRVILPVHLYGRPCDMAPIMALAKEHGLKVLDDAAQAHHAHYRGKPVGGLAHLTAWSFYPGKNLGAYGDGGALTTDDPALADRLRVLRNYGSRVKYVNEVKGVNSRLDEVQAAVLLAKLPHLAQWNARRTALATRYLDALKGLPLTLPSLSSVEQSAWHLFVVRAHGRDALQKALKERGVDTIIHYPIPPFLQDAYAEFRARAADFPLANQMAQDVLSLPMGPHLSTAEQDQVIAAVKAALT